MRLKIALALLVMVVVVLPRLAIGGPGAKGHAHKTARGGIVQEANGIKAEFVLDKDGQPKVYFFGGEMKALGRADIPTKLTVKGHDGTQFSRDLKAVKDPNAGIVYQGDPIKGLKDWDTAVVSIKLKDRWSHFRYSHH